MPKKSLEPVRCKDTHSFFGLVSQHKEYRIRYFLRRYTGIDLNTKTCILLNKNRNTPGQELLTFRQSDTDSPVQLIVNKCNGKTAFPPLKQADYLLALSDTAYSSDEQKELMEKIKTIPAIQHIFVLNSGISSQLKGITFE